MCTDANIELRGDYNSDKTSMFKIALRRCDPEKRQCKSDEEIEDWMKRKFIVVLKN